MKKQLKERSETRKETRRKGKKLKKGETAGGVLAWAAAGVGLSAICQGHRSDLIAEEKQRSIRVSGALAKEGSLNDEDTLPVTSSP